MSVPLILAVITTLSLQNIQISTEKTLPPPPLTDQVQQDTPKILEDVPNRSEALRQASEILNRLKTVQADFVQTGPDGSVVDGRIFLQRPGKVRFDYAAPAPFLIVSDGVTVAKIDKDLETSDRIPLSSTPLSIFLGQKIDLEHKAEVLDLKKRGESLFITLRDPKGEAEGQLTLIFTTENGVQNFTGWAVTDGLGYVTRIDLRAVQQVKRLNPRLFLVDEAENSVLKRPRQRRR